MIKPPDIELVLEAAQCWRAVYTRNPAYTGYGSTPVEALGQMMITNPSLFGFRQVRFSKDAATQTHITSSGIDSVLVTNRGYYDK